MTSDEKTKDMGSNVNWGCLVSWIFGNFVDVPDLGYVYCITGYAITMPAVPLDRTSEYRSMTGTNIQREAQRTQRLDIFIETSTNKCSGILYKWNKPRPTGYYSESRR